MNRVAFIHLGAAMDDRFSNALRCIALNLNRFAAGVKELRGWF